MKMSEAWHDFHDMAFDEGYIHQFQPDSQNSEAAAEELSLKIQYPPIEHLLNDHKDRPNQRDCYKYNSYK